jgi:DNA-binding HxlR family transcriptional regulator
MTQRGQLGVRTLDLLAEEWMVAILRGLAEGALRPTELERALPGAVHTTVLRRLRRLLDSDLVNYEHEPGVPPQARTAAMPPRAFYTLTDAGRALREVTAEAGRWEQTWCSPVEVGGAAGSLAIKLVADHHTRAIALVLADRPLSPRELEARVPNLGRSALRRRMGELVLAGLLQRHGRPSAPEYALTPAARRLALVAMLAGRWEWQWSQLSLPAHGADLRDLVRMLAPVARVPEPVVGVCQLHLDTGATDDRDIYLAARTGTVRALAAVPTAPPDAVGRATPEALCNALLQRNGPIEISGSRELLAAVIHALSTALVGQPPAALR